MSDSSLSGSAERTLPHSCQSEFVEAVKGYHRCKREPDHPGKHFCGYGDCAQTWSDEQAKNYVAPSRVSPSATAARCLITHNPVGTDTRPGDASGRIIPCPCANCSPSSPVPSSGSEIVTSENWRGVLREIAEPHGLNPDAKYKNRECAIELMISTLHHLAGRTPPSRGSEEELGKLLDEWEDARIEYSEWYRNADYHDSSFDWSRIHNARQRLESYVSRLRKELKFAARSALLLDDQFKEVCAELATLKEQQLTRDEAETLLLIEKWATKGHRAVTMKDVEASALAKLRLLSTSDSEQQQKSKSGS